VAAHRVHHSSPFGLLGLVAQEAFWGRQVLRGHGSNRAPAHTRPQNKCDLGAKRAFLKPNDTKGHQMAEIGRLQPEIESSLSRLAGRLDTMDGSYLVRLEGDERLCNDRQPSHRVIARSRTGHEVEVGSAWLKTTKHGPNVGLQFFSITIDHPGLPAPLNVAAFPNRERSDWIVTWRRRGAVAQSK